MTPPFIDNTPNMRIGDAAKATGLSASSLRQYEQLGLLLPDRDAAGNRLYSRNEIDWVKKLQHYFRQTRTGPHAMAKMLALLPSQHLRRRILGVPCHRAESKGICWMSSGDDAGYRAECRSCPAYLGKEMVLRFEEFFEVVPRGTEPRISFTRAETVIEQTPPLLQKPLERKFAVVGQSKKPQG